jgi:hypothetical protein
MLKKNQKENGKKFELNSNENTIRQNFWDITKVVL